MLVTIVTFISVYFFIEPISQDKHYHCFANEVKYGLIMNFWNVVSNMGFVMIGIYGVLVLPIKGKERLLIFSLFLGILATGIGSAYYHFTPNNHTLVWDRIPMTIIFSSFFCIVYAKLIDRCTAYLIWLFELVLGIYSVFYWQYSESIGAGDLRLYAIVQFLPMLLLVIMIILRFQQSRFVLNTLVAIIFWYGIAKFFEHYDHQLFDLTHTFSGHPLKHLAATVATFYMISMVNQFEAR